VKLRALCIIARDGRERERRITIETNAISRRRCGVLIDFNFMQYSVTVVTCRRTTASSKFNPRSRAGRKKSRIRIEIQLPTPPRLSGIFVAPAIREIHLRRFPNARGFLDGRAGGREGGGRILRLKHETRPSPARRIRVLVDSHVGKFEI